MDKDRSLNRNWIAKSNSFVNARYDWTLMQQRVILTAVAQLDWNQEEFHWQRIHFADLKSLTGTKSNSFNKEIGAAAQELLGQQIWVQEGGKHTGLNLLSGVRYADDTYREYIEVKFNADMRPLLLHLKQHFTRYMLEQVLKLKSGYAIRLFELLSQFADLGYRTISVGDFRNALMLEDKYARFSDLKRRIIDPNIEDINKKTELTAKYNVERQGRTPVKLHFRIWEGKDHFCIS